MSLAAVCSALGSLCARCFCSPSYFFRGTKPSIGLDFTFAKQFYFWGFWLTIVATGCLRQNGGSLLAQYCFGSSEPVFKQCADEVVLRVSFGSFVFFMLHFLVCLRMTREDDTRVSMYTGFFFWKLLVWVGTQIGFFYAPASVSQNSCWGQIVCLNRKCNISGPTSAKSCWNEVQADRYWLNVLKVPQSSLNTQTCKCASVQLRVFWHWNHGVCINVHVRTITLHVYSIARHEVQMIQQCVSSCLGTATTICLIFEVLMLRCLCCFVLMKIKQIQQTMLELKLE